MKTLLTVICVLTLLAVGYLSLSLIVLRPPRANYQGWFTLAALIAVQTAVTLGALTIPHAWLRMVATAGGAALTVAGVWMVRQTLASSRFEGYALVLGAMLVMQGALTVLAFLKWQPVRTAQ
jgi:hypothetical protein